MKNLRLKRITLTSVLTAAALISFMLENLFPPILFPGARLGISNAFILLTLILCKSPYAFASLIIKCVLGSVFSGNISAALYSLPSGALALAVEILLFRLNKKFSITAISIVGGIINITVQNIIFCLVATSATYLYYLPYLAILGGVSGAAVGIAVYYIIKILPSFFVFHEEDEARINQ